VSDSCDAQVSGLDNWVGICAIVSRREQFVVVNLNLIDVRLIPSITTC
jgi:hypothetical protein